MRQINVTTLNKVVEKGFIYLWVKPLFLVCLTRCYLPDMGIIRVGDLNRSRCYPADRPAVLSPPFNILRRFPALLIFTASREA